MPMFGAYLRRSGGTVRGALTVQGTTTLAALVASGAVTLQNAVTMLSTLGVTGNVTLGTDSAGNYALRITSGNQMHFRLGGDTQSQYTETATINNSGTKTYNQFTTGDGDGAWRRQISGAGSHDFINRTTSLAGNTPLFRVADAGGAAANWLQAAGGIAGAAPVLSVQGSDAAINLDLTPKGTGTLRYKGARLPFTQAAALGDQVITAAGLLIIAHGLERAPILVQSHLVCQTAEQGYSIGDVVVVSMTQGEGGSYSGSCVIDATNVVYRYGNSANAFYVVNKTTGNRAPITNANWKLRLVAYA